MPLRKHPLHPGHELRDEIAKLGYSVAEAAERLGVTRQALYNVLNGKSAITPEMAVRLAADGALTGRTGTARRTPLPV